MITVDLKIDLILALVGILYSVAFSVIPGLRVKFAQWAGEWKALLQIGVMILVASTVFALGCWKVIIIPGWTCTTQDVWKLGFMLLFAIGGNQLGYISTPTLNDVKQVFAAKTALAISELPRSLQPK